MAARQEKILLSKSEKKIWLFIYCAEAVEITHHHNFTFTILTTHIVTLGQPVVITIPVLRGVTDRGHRATEFGGK